MQARNGSDLPDIFSGKKKRVDKQQEHDQVRLFEQIDRLKVEADWLKKNLKSLSNSEKKALIGKLGQRLSISKQCKLLGCSSSSYYHHTKDDMMINSEIDKVYTKHTFKGSRTITDDLRISGIEVGRYKVRRLMSEMDILAIYPKKHRYTKNEGHKKYPYLLKNLDIYRSDLVWVSDITYIPLKHGNAYLTAVMDWHSRYVLS